MQIWLEMDEKDNDMAKLYYKGVSEPLLAAAIRLDNLQDMMDKDTLHDLQKGIPVMIKIERVES